MHRYGRVSAWVRDAEPKGITTATRNQSQHPGGGLYRAGEKAVACPAEGTQVRCRTSQGTSSRSQNLEHRYSHRPHMMAARAQGVSAPELVARLQELVTADPPDHFLIVEPEPGISLVLKHEVQ